MSTTGKKLTKGMREQTLDQALEYLRKDRKGQPTHNHTIARELGVQVGPEGTDRLYRWMKDDERFIFRPDDLPASFKPAPKRPARKTAAKKGVQVSAGAV